jgi:hypothetical protein
MKGFFYRVIVGFIALGSPLSAQSQQPTTTEKKAGSSLTRLLDQNFLPKQPKHQAVICNVEAFCNPATQMANLAEIEALHFTVIDPVIVTGSRAQLLQALETVSACRSLGVISEVRTTVYEADSTKYEIYRPATEFALYQLYLDGKRYVAIRAGGYIDSGIAVTGPDAADNNDEADNQLPPNGVRTKDTSGTVSIVDPDRCVAIQRVPYKNSFTLDYKARTSRIGDDNSWAVVPIIFKGQTYLLNISSIREIKPTHNSYGSFLSITQLNSSSIPSVTFYTPEKDDK